MQIPDGEQTPPPRVAVKSPSDVTVNAGPLTQVTFMTPPVGLLALSVIVLGELVSVEQSPTAEGDPLGPFTVVDGTV